MVVFVLFLIVAGAIFGRGLYNRYQRIQLLNRYAVRFEHVYVVQDNLRTGQSIQIQPDLMPFVVTCHQYEMMNEVKRQKSLLQESGNKFFANEKLAKSQQLQVIPIFWQSGEYVNETWEEFQERVEAEIKASRAQRHKMLKQADANWYLVKQHNQTWEWAKN